MRMGWRGVLGIILSIVLLYWTVRGVSMQTVWQVLMQSNIPLLLVAAGVATIPFPIRAWRWRYILHPVAPDTEFGPLWRSTAIGMMVNNLVPARAGEVARAYSLHREVRRIPFIAALGSLAVDRIFDGLAILLYLLAVILLPGFPSEHTLGGRSVESWLLLATAVALGALVLVGIVAYFPQQMARLWDAVAMRVAPGLAPRGRTLLLSFASGVGVLRDPPRFLLVLVLSLFQWMVNGIAFYLAFLALGISAPFPAAMFLQSLLALGVAVPSSPGFFGIFEAVSRAGLAVYGVDQTLAVSFAIGFHVTSFVPITLIGLWYAGRLGLHLRDLGAPAPSTE